MSFVARRDPSTAQPCGSAPCFGLGEGGGEGGEGRSSPWAARPRGRLPGSQGPRQEHGAKSQEREAKSRCASLRCLRHLPRRLGGGSDPRRPPRRASARPPAAPLRCAASGACSARRLGATRFPSSRETWGPRPQAGGRPGPYPCGHSSTGIVHPRLWCPLRAGGAGDRQRPVAGRDLHGVAAAPGGGPARVAPGCLSLAAIPILADADHSP